MKTQAVKAHSLRTGTITVGTSPIQGPEIRAAPDRAIVLIADAGNPGKVYIGYDENVTVDIGFPVQAGDALSLNVDNLSDIWFVADQEDQKIRYIVEVVS